METYKYDKKAMLQIVQECPRCLERPECLSSKFNNESGLWCPELWLQSMWVEEDPSQTNARSNSSQAKHKKQEDEPAVEKEPYVNKKKQVDRLKSEDDVVLSPQRRSFGAGCHVTSRRSDSPWNELNRETEAKGRGGAQSVQSAQGNRTREYVNSSLMSNGRLERNGDVKRPWEKDRPDRRDYGDRRPPNDFSNNRRVWRREDEQRRERVGDRFSNQQQQQYYSERDRYYSSSVEKDEPEWMTDGPTSMTDTIELHGFEEESPEKPAGASGLVKHIRDPTSKTAISQVLSASQRSTPQNDASSNASSSRASPVSTSSKRKSPKPNVVIRAESGFDAADQVIVTSIHSKAVTTTTTSSDTATVPSSVKNEQEPVKEPPRAADQQCSADVFASFRDPFLDFDLQQYLGSDLFGLDGPAFQDSSVVAQGEAAKSAVGGSRFSKFFDSSSSAASAFVPGDQNNNKKGVSENNGFEQPPDILKLLSKANIRLPESGVQTNGHIMHNRANGDVKSVEEVEASLRSKQMPSVDRANQGQSSKDAGIENPLLQNLFKSAVASNPQMPQLPQPPSNALTEEQVLASMKSSSMRPESIQQQKLSETLHEQQQVRNFLMERQRQQALQQAAVLQQLPPPHFPLLSQPNAPPVQQQQQAQVIDTLRKLHQSMLASGMAPAQVQLAMEQLMQQSSAAGHIAPPIAADNLQHSQMLPSCSSQAPPLSLLTQSPAIGGMTPPELLFHTNQIYQRALLNRKLEEQQNFRRQPDGHAGASMPQPSSGKVTAFTPTSVLKQLHSLKLKDHPEAECSIDGAGGQRAITKSATENKAQFVVNQSHASQQPNAPTSSGPEFAKLVEAQQKMRLALAAEHMKQVQLAGGRAAAAPPFPPQLLVPNNPLLAIRAQQAAAQAQLAMMQQQQVRPTVIDPVRAALLLQQQQQQQQMNPLRVRSPLPGAPCVPMGNMNAVSLLESLQLQQQQQQQGGRTQMKSPLPVQQHPNTTNIPPTSSMLAPASVMRVGPPQPLVRGQIPVVNPVTTAAPAVNGVGTTVPPELARWFNIPPSSNVNAGAVHSSENA